MENYSYVVKIIPAHSASQRDVFVREYLIWKQAVSMLTDISFLADGKKTILTLDWGNATEILNNLEIFRNAERNRGSVDQETLQSLFEKHVRTWESGDDKINLTCKILTEEKHDPVQFVKHFLFLLYLSINIAEPGAGGLFAEISQMDDSTQRPKDSVFSISSEPFENIDIPLRKFAFPPFVDLKFKDTWDWFEMIGIRNQAIADTNLQRAVFALLNYCQNDSYLNPTGLLWLALGLESLYDLPSIGIASALRERIFLTLGVPKNSTKIKRLISDFYTLRSKFVHGRLEILNPIVGNAYLTNEVTDKYEVPIWDASYFSMAVLVSTLQRMVSEKWANLHFETTLSGA